MLTDDAAFAPRPTLDDWAFWDHCRERRLMIQACAGCGRARHPPRPVCWACGSDAHQWIQAPETAEVYSFTVIHHVAHPSFASRVPYVVAIVTFDPLPGVRLVTNLVRVDPARVRSGMRVRLAWEPRGAGLAVPVFEPSATAPA